MARIGGSQSSGIVTFSVIVTGWQERPRVGRRAAAKEKSVKNSRMTKVAK